MRRVQFGGMGEDGEWKWEVESGRRRGMICGFDCSAEYPIFTIIFCRTPTKLGMNIE